MFRGKELTAILFPTTESYPAFNECTRGGKVQTDIRRIEHWWQMFPRRQEGLTERRWLRRTIPLIQIGARQQGVMRHERQYGSLFTGVLVNPLMRYMYRDKGSAPSRENAKVCREDARS